MNLIAFPIVMCILSDNYNSYDFAYIYVVYTTIVLVFNIPIAVFLSIDNNDVNLSRERQRNNSQVWDLISNQQSQSSSNNSSISAKLPQHDIKPNLETGL